MTTVAIFNKPLTRNTVNRLYRRRQQHQFRQHFPPHSPWAPAPGRVDHPLIRIATFPLSGTDRFPTRRPLARTPDASPKVANVA